MRFGRMILRRFIPVNAENGFLRKNETMMIVILRMMKNDKKFQSDADS